MLLAHIDPRDPPRRFVGDPLPRLGILTGVVKHARNENHLVIRTGGGLMVPHQLDHAQAPLSFPTGLGGGKRRRGKLKGVVRLFGEICCRRGRGPERYDDACCLGRPGGRGD